MLNISGLKMMSNLQEGAGCSESEGEMKFGFDDNFGVSPNTLKTIVTECLNSWVNYLQVLNSFCSAGFRLSQCLVTLAQTQTVPLALQCHASWEELGKATIIASNTVKTHIAAAMQDMVICEPISECDVQRQMEHNQQIIHENLLTFINLQYQFSIAGCECFGNMATCPCCQTVSGLHDAECNMATLQRCFSKLYNHDSQMSSPHRSSVNDQQGIEAQTLSELQQPSPPLNREPSPVHNLPLVTNRNTHLESIRGPFPAPGLLHTMKGPFRNARSPLYFPLFPLSGQRRWSEVATGERTSETNADTMRRWSMPYDCARLDSGTKFHLPTSKLSTSHQEQRSRSNTPALIENICNPSITSSEGLVEAIQLLSSRPKTTHGGLNQLTHESTHSDHSTHKRLQHIQHHRSNWQSTDSTVGSRKSSSSTDSSSCLSIHSRSTSGSDTSGRNADGGGESVRMHHHLYSIWSGSDHLPFIRLPESQEPLDDSDTESADNSTNSLYPRPT